VTGPVITVKYKDGEQNITVSPDVPVVRFEVGDRSAIVPGAVFTVFGAVKQADGSFDVSRINVGRDGAAPP
jgi:hypothetical protein